MTRTAISQAFADAGLHPRDAELDVAIAKYINSGGTIDGAQQRLRLAAERMSMQGPDVNISYGGQKLFAEHRQPIEDDQANQSMLQNRKIDASSSSSSSAGQGQRSIAKEGQATTAKAGANPNRERETAMNLPEKAVDPMFPAREPKAAIRPPLDFGAASLAIKTKLAQSVLDRAKTSDGRAWGDVGAHELDGMDRDGALARAIKVHIGVLSNAQRFLTIRELVKPEVFEAIRSAAHGA